MDKDLLPMSVPVGSDEVVKVWDLKNLALTRILRDKHHRWGQITALKWTQDAVDDMYLLLIGTARGRLAIYSWASREVRSTSHVIRLCLTM